MGKVCEVVGMGRGLMRGDLWDGGDSSCLRGWESEGERGDEGMGKE